jgi:hypothetical protein
MLGMWNANFANEEWNVQRTDPRLYIATLDLPSETPETRTVPRHIRFDTSDSEDETHEGDDDPQPEQTEGSGDIPRPRLADIMDPINMWSI